MARQIGDVTLGFASEAGFPAIDGVDPTVLAFPAFTAEQALTIVPETTTGAPIANWGLGLDLYIEQPAEAFVSILQIGEGDGEIFLNDNGDGTAGVGISGVYDGAFEFDAWNRLVLTVGQEGDGTVLRKYLNGSLIGTQDLGDSDRWTIDPSIGLKLFNDDDGETGSGAVSSVFFTDIVASPDDTLALVASIPTPDAAGFFAEPPVPALEINFQNEDLAPRYGNAAVILEGFDFRSPVVTNESAIALASQFGITGPEGVDIPVLDYAAYGPDEGITVSVPPIAGDLSSYTAIFDINVDTLDGFQALLQTDITQASDGELFIDGMGGLGINGDYDGAVVAGEWARIAITVDDQGEGTSTLRKYLNGVLLDSQTVDTSRFTLNAATGFLLLTDNDGETGEGYLAHFGLSEEVLDAAAILELGGADADGPFEATPDEGPTPLAETSEDTRTLTLSFDSSFRPFDGMTGEVQVSFDGGDFQSLIVFDTANSGGDSSLTRVNEPVALDFEAPVAAENVSFSFNLRNAGNDWWWAVDNIVLTETDTGGIIFAENFDGLSNELQTAVDENIGALGWTQTPPDGWTNEDDPAMPQGTTEWQGWSFATPQFWTSADGQNRTDFQNGTGVVAIADPDEWDDFNGGSQNGADFNSTLTTPQISLAIPSTPGTYQFGFDGYEETVEFGFQDVTVVDVEEVPPLQDNIDDRLVRQGTPQTIDLAEAFGAEASDFTVTSTDGSIIDAVIDGTVLTLTPGALGHSDITVTAQLPNETVLEENFRAIVAGPNAYVFAIIPDTQDYTSNQTLEDNSFFRMTEWLLDQEEALSIQHAIHVGDIVQFGAVNQWLIAEDAMERLDGEISYTLAIGNHDQQRPGFASAFSFETDVDTYFTPVQVGATPEQGGGTYDGFDVGEDVFDNGNTYADSIRNHYTTLETPDGTKWLIFSLEFGMPDDVLRWAGEVIEEHLDHRVIIDTHSWNGGDTRITPLNQPLTTDNGGWGYDIRDNPRSVNDGEDAWREFASKYPNVMFTFNGHNFMGGAETVVSYAAGDNPVLQMFVNYQNGAWRGVEGIGTNGGNGAMRLVVMDPDNERITTHTKLVELDTYFNDFPDHEEVFENIDIGTPEMIAIAKAGATEVVIGDGIKATVSLDPSATIGNTEGATYLWRNAEGETFGETDGAPLEVWLPNGVNTLTLEVTDANGNVSTDEKTVIVEAPDALLTDTFDDGDLLGWVPADANAALAEIGTDIGFGQPAIEPGAVQIPLTITFDSHWRPFDNQTGTVALSFDGGEPVDVLRYDSSNTDDTNFRNETLTINAFAPSSASEVEVLWRYDDADNDWYWAIDNVNVSSPSTVTLFEEDWESAPLEPFVNEDGGDGTDWSATLPAGWTTVNETPPGGIDEFFGWTLLDFNAWVATAGDQQRSQYTNAIGTIVVADPDEYDDGATDIDPDLFAAELISPAIDLSQNASSEVTISFDSSWRYEDLQEAIFSVSFDGGAKEQVFRWASDQADPDFKDDATNERVSVTVATPDDATQMQLHFDMPVAGNDWWWAVDNIEVTGTAITSLISEDFDGLTDELQSAQDEFIEPSVLGWTHTPPTGWSREVDPDTPDGTTEWRGWSFVTPEFWTAAEGQARDEFSKGTGIIAVADGDEWDDFNGGAGGNNDSLDTTIGTPGLNLTSIGGGQAPGEEAGIARVPALSPNEGILVTPGATGQFSTYTLVFDILASATNQSFTALFQTDVNNSDDADIYLRNDGETYSIGISGDYDGAVPYGEWARIALVFETQTSGEQTLAKYVNGTLLDTQTVTDDVAAQARWTIDADTGFLLFSEPNNFTSEIYANAVHFTPEALSESEVAALGAVDVDGPLETSANADAFQLNFDTGLNSLDFGMATVEEVRLGGPATSFIVKGSIFGNPNGEGEAALYAQTNGPNEILLWETGTEWSNYTFEFIFEPGDNDTVGALFYYQDESNFYELTLDQQNDERVLTKVKDGVATELAREAGSYQHFADQKLSVSVVDDRISIVLGEDLLFDGPIVVSDPLDGGTVGLVSRNMDRLKFDNVSVNPVDLSARALGVTPDERNAADLDDDGFATVNLTAEASSSLSAIDTYEWLVDGEVVGSGETVAIEFAPGTTPVTLRVTQTVDNGVRTAEDVIEVTVAAHADVLLSDDFDDGNADGWMIVDEGAINAPSDWSVENGAFVQSSDIGSEQQGTGSNAFSVEGDGPFILRDGTYALWDDPEAAGWTDYAFETTISTGDTAGIGVLFRYQDAENYYKLEADADIGIIQLTRHLDGRETILARGWHEYTPGEEEHWRIEAEKGSLTAYIDGVEVFGTDIDDRTIENGTVGLYTWSSEGVSFDNVVVTNLSDPLDDAVISETTAARRDKLEGTPGEVDAFVIGLEGAGFFSRDEIIAFEGGDRIDVTAFGFEDVAEGRDFPLEAGTLRVIDYGGTFVGLYGTTDAGDLGLRVDGDIDDVLAGLLI